jgi:hypothetical protein
MRGFDRDLIRGGHYGQRSRDLLGAVRARIFKSLAALAKSTESLVVQPLPCHAPCHLRGSCRTILSHSIALKGVA